ncbi:maleylpyruvate isomerase family mycothiol-dependent enzyme [Streptomyces sp. CT34]|uniref:maleylpyruvate isomerase family mycothiol-dependent enzyme n=1 Tax=Streptomyces sp. CT34 TaxID=1553907 RepID=UPI0005BE4DFB|nr:maleylpyruvate isomerase family mycothiol-dependent enzyme [Streptomyces sp. CT34]
MTAHPPPTAEAVRDEIEAGHARLRGLLPGLTDTAVREPGALPGWSRAHVLSHIEGIGHAMARQARHALRGELIAVYDGGFPARSAAIEEGSRRDAAAIRQAVTDTLAEASAAWAAVGPADWSRPVGYRDGELRGALLAWWRELAIHTADALLGHSPADWSPALCHHLLEHLAPRAPQDLRLALEATDDATPRPPYGPADAPTVTVRGTLTDLAAWLAGRTPRDALRCTRAGTGAPLPRLGDWP